MLNKLTIFVFIILTISSKVTCYGTITNDWNKDTYVSKESNYTADNKGYLEQGRSDSGESRNIDNLRIIPEPATLFLLSLFGLVLFSRKFGFASFFPK